MILRYLKPQRILISSLNNQPTKCKMSFILLLTIKRNKQTSIEKKNYYQILTIHSMLTAKKRHTKEKVIILSLVHDS